MEQWMKYIRSLDATQRKRFFQIIEIIKSKNREGMDIERMKGSVNERRCVVGQWRIRFKKDEAGEIYISKVGPRGDVYKK